MPFQKPRILVGSEINMIRGKCLVGSATPVELMQAFGHFDLVIMELQQGLAPFAAMYRPNTDLKEVACQRGTASDLTIITSGDFAVAAELVDKY